ncbi:MAG: hypothetical protein ACI828_002284 [Flavobacteriales bacterium]
MIATESMKKKLVLIVLFVLPIVTYLFFTTSVANFISLPVVTTGVNDIAEFDVKEVNTPYNDTVSLLLKDKVTIIGYLGDKLKTNVGYTANLNLTIFKYYQGFGEFQMIFFVNPGSEAQVEEVKESLARVTDVSKLRFVEATPEQARRHFDGLKTPYAAANDGYSPFVFVVDKELNLRSRNDDLKKENDYGYDLTQAVEMGYLKEDIKVVLAAYRLALRKNKNATAKIEQRRPEKE